MRRTKRNPAVPWQKVYRNDQWDVDPAHLTEDHWTDKRTKRAITVARKAFKGQGEYLGRGNFGLVYKVGGWAVKIPAAEDMHGRVWPLEEIRQFFMHEAGNSNHLRRFPDDVVPEITYVEVDGKPALVREYGTPVEDLTPAKFQYLEEQLMDIEAVHGWRVKDELLPMYRSNGSMFIADVGLWEPIAKGPGKYKSDSGLGDLLGQLLRKQPWAGKDRVPSLPSLRETARLIRELLEFDDGDDLFLGIHKKGLDSGIAKRQAIGLSVPPDLIALQIQLSALPR